MKFKGVHQYNSKDCGVACLLSIIKYYGGNNTFENIRYLTKCDEKGVSALNLIEASKKLGFNSKGLKYDINFIYNIKLPAIAHVIINNYYHYVVILKVYKEKIYVFDPAKGNMTYTKLEFIKIWNGIILELIPYRKLDNINTKIDKSLFNTILKNKYMYIFIFILTFIYIIFSLANNYYFKLLINNNNILKLLLLFIFLVIFKEFIDYIKNILVIKLDNNIDKEISITTHKKLLSLPYYYFNSKTIGDITSRIKDLDYVKELFIKLPISLFIDFPLVIFSTIILLKINKKLFFIFLITTMLYIFITIIFNKKNKNMIRNNQENNAINNEILIENIKIINTIKNLNIENNRNNLYEESYNKYLNNKKSYENHYNLELLLKNIVLYVGLNIILYFGILYVRKNILEIGDLVLFNSIMIYFIESIKSLYEISPLFKNGINALKRINEIFLINNSICKNIKIKNFNIKINNLSYSYNNYDYVLKNLNLNIQNKEKVMIYGKSGCGKSTLFKILNKNYDVERQKVYINNVDINDIKTKNYLCYVSQEESLFNDSIYNNLTLGLKIDIDLIKKVMNITKLDLVLKNKNMDLENIIEENGVNFSGGERQKIILTRVLLKNSNILILDEALNGIDEFEEYEILKNIIILYSNKTIIYITHRKNCMNLFNRKINFLKLKEGK